MKFKTTIVIAIIAIVGAAYVFLYEKKQESAEIKYEQQRKVFYGLNSNSIFKIKVIKNGETFLFTKKSIDFSGRNGKWMMEKPIMTRADKAVIKGFLSELEFLERVSRFEGEDNADSNKENYGFDKPTFEITFWTNQTRIIDTGNADSSPNASGVMEYSFFIGDRVPTGEHVYAQLKDSDEVMVIKDAVAMKLDFDLNGFRDKWISDIDIDAVSHIEIQRGKDGVIVCAKDVDLWWMSEPVKDRCDNKKLMEIVESLRNLKAEEEDFLTEADSDPTRYGLVNPRYRVVIEQNGVKQGVSFGHLLDNKVYAKRDSEKTIFLVKDNIINDLAINPDNLRSRAMVRFETAAGTLGVERIEINTRQTKISIEKTKLYDWQITEPIEVLADIDVIKELIEDVKDLRILEFVTNKSDDLSKYGLKEPVFILSVYKKNIDKPTTTYFGNLTKDGEQCYAKRPDEDPVFSITSKGIYKKLLGGLFTLRDKLVSDFDKNLVNNVIVVRDGITFNIEKNSGKESNWILKEPVKGFPDDSLVDQMVQSVSFLKAEKYVAKLSENQGRFGFDNSTLKVTMLYEKIAGHVSGDQDVADPVVKDEPINMGSFVLLIGDKVTNDDSSNYYGMVEGDDLVFELDRKVVGYFYSEIVSKSIQRFNASKVNKLVLSYPDRKVIFGRPAGVWKAVQPVVDDVNSREIEYMNWLLSDFKADRIIEYNLNNVISYGLDIPDIKITVHLDDGKLFEVLAVNNGRGDGYFVMSRNSNCIYSVNTEVIKMLIEQDIVPAENKIDIIQTGTLIP
ncbi:MAG: DUF4340 domain-containing protein [Candidatus Anammoxibacter sp.]